MVMSAKEKMRKYRDRLRAEGLRPVQIWVPDTTRPGFREQFQRQARIVHSNAREKETLDWIEELADFRGWQ